MYDCHIIVGICNAIHAVDMSSTLKWYMCLPKSAQGLFVAPSAPGWGAFFFCAPRPAPRALDSPDHQYHDQQALIIILIGFPQYLVQQHSCCKQIVPNSFTNAVTAISMVVPGGLLLLHSEETDWPFLCVEETYP